MCSANTTHQTNKVTMMDIDEKEFEAQMKGYSDNMDGLKKAVEDGQKANAELVRKMDEHGEKGDVIARDEIAKLKTAVTAAVEAQDRIMAKMEAPSTGSKGESMAKEVEAFSDMVGKSIDEDTYLRHKAAVRQLLRAGADKSALSPDVLKDITSATDAAGGVLVDSEMAADIATQRAEISPMRSVCNVVNTSQSSFVIVRSDGSTAAAQGTGNTAAAKTANSTYTEEDVKIFTNHVLVPVAQNVIDDSAFDLAGQLAMEAGDAIGEIEATGFINGNGTTSAKGITNYAPGNGAGQIGRTTTNGANLNFGDLIAAIGSLKDRYVQNATWLLHRQAVWSIVGMRDQNESLVYLPSAAAGTPGVLLGFPMVIASQFAAPAAGAVIGAVGDFRQGYTIVDRQGIVVRQDPYSEVPLVRFYFATRSGGAARNLEAIKTIRIKA